MVYTRRRLKSITQHWVPHPVVPPPPPPPQKIYIYNNNNRITPYECPFFSHAVRKPKPQPTFPPYGGTAPGTVPGTVPVTAVTGTSTIPANFPPPPGQSIQPRMTADGKSAQTSVLGNCSFPGCLFPRSFDGNRVHDYCSRTCAQKHAELRSAFEKQKAAAAGISYGHILKMSW